MEYRENWCSDTCSRGSLKPGSILPWKSFEHLSWKQGRNQKQRLIRSTHHSQCSLPKTVYQRLVICHKSSLARFLTRCWASFSDMRGSLLQCKIVVLQFYMKWTDKLKLVVKLKCVSVVLFFYSVLIDPPIPPAEQQRCCCSCQMLTAAN